MFLAVLSEVPAVPNHPDFLDAYVEELVDGFPPLTEAQRDRLRVLLPPSQDGGTDAVA